MITGAYEEAEGIPFRQLRGRGQGQRQDSGLTALQVDRLGQSLQQCPPVAQVSLQGEPLIDRQRVLQPQGKGCGLPLGDEGGQSRILVLDGDRKRQRFGPCLVDDLDHLGTIPEGYLHQDFFSGRELCAMVLSRSHRLDGDRFTTGGAQGDRGHAAAQDPFRRDNMPMQPELTRGIGGRQPQEPRVDALTLKPTPDPGTPGKHGRLLWGVGGSGTIAQVPGRDQFEAYPIVVSGCLLTPQPKGHVAGRQPEGGSGRLAPGTQGEMLVLVACLALPEQPGIGLDSLRRVQVKPCSIPARHVELEHIDIMEPMEASAHLLAQP